MRKLFTFFLFVLINSSIFSETFRTYIGYTVSGNTYYLHVDSDPVSGEYGLIGQLRYTPSGGGGDQTTGWSLQGSPTPNGTTQRYIISVTIPSGATNLHYEIANRNQSGNDYGWTGFQVLSGPLPIIISNFSINGNNSKANLFWSTASETNNDYFEVLHSSTGKDWQVLGMVNGAGNSNTTQEYSFVHNTPAKGKSFYRLRQVDYDGKYEYSPIRSVVSQGVRKEISLAPNPASDLVSIIHDGSSTTFDISIRDITGRTITEYKNYSAETLDISPLSSGLYTITITSDGVTTTQRLIKE